MRAPSTFRLFWVLLATAIAFFQIFRLTLGIALDGINLVTARLQATLNWESAPFYTLCSQSIAIGIVLFFLISPLWLDAIVGQYHTLLELSPRRLENFPETAGLIDALGKKHRFRKPRLKLLVTRFPIAFAYGSTPLTARVVLSAGLLEHLSDAELATLYATLFGQVLSFDFFWLSGATALLQIPYILHWRLGKLENIAPLRLFHTPIAAVSALFYGIYRFWRLPLLWLSRQRIYYSDRYGVEVTGDPNALCRALLKIANGTSERVQKIGRVPPLVESLALLLPIDPRQTLCLGTLSPSIPYESVLRWDCVNPYRHWLSLSHSHPLPGERLFLLGKYASYWGVEPELDLSDRRPSLVNKAELWTKLANFHKALPILPRSFAIAFVVGILLRSLFWLVGLVSERWRFTPLIWMHESYPLLNAWVGWVAILCVLLLVFLFSKRFPHIFACAVILETLVDLIGRYGGQQLAWLDNRDPFFDAWMVIALSFSVLIWLNGYFPALSRSVVLENPDIGRLLASERALPSRGVAIRLEGKLLGRKGIVNWSARDLLLQTPTGTIELKYVSSLGPIGNLFSLSPRPCQFIDREVTVSGWFRRGSSPWIDVDTLAIGGIELKCGHQIWLTLLALAAAFWGTYQILTV
jgi:Zn-dependent protease with chaperone function